MPRLRTLAVALFVGLFLLAGCASGDNGEEGSTAEEEQTGDDDAAAADGGESQPPSGVAASVGEAEIEESTVEGLYEGLASSPVFAEQLQGEQGARASEMLRSQILSRLVVQEIVLQAAEEEYDVALGQDDLDASLEEFVAEAGGEEAFEDRLEESGLSRDAFVRLELPLAAALGELEEEFGVDAPPEGQDPSQMTDEQAELQNWVAEKFAEAEVRVADGYGTWNPQTGQIQPQGAAPMPQPGEVPPPPEE